MEESISKVDAEAEVKADTEVKAKKIQIESDFGKNIEIENPVEERR